jgi:NOL1/NOP2/fmu family ribosome biogenesis protein
MTDSRYSRGIDERGGREGREEPAPSAADVLAYLEERFGLERALFDGFGLYATSKGRIYLGPKRLVNHPRIATLGLLIARSHGAIKPSTNLLQLFGRQVKKNYVELAKEDAAAFIGGADVRLPGAEAAVGVGADVRHPNGAGGGIGDTGVATDGYVLVRYLGFSLGCGMLHSGPHGAEIRNMLPKAKRLAISYL